MRRFALLVCVAYAIAAVIALWHAPLVLALVLAHPLAALLVTSLVAATFGFVAADLLTRSRARRAECVECRAIGGLCDACEDGFERARERECAGGCGERESDCACPPALA